MGFALRISGLCALLAVCAALVFCLAMYTPNLRWSGLKDLLTVPAEAAEGYAVADSHTCGSDDERTRSPTRVQKTC